MDEARYLLGLFSGFTIFLLFLWRILRLF